MKKYLAKLIYITIICIILISMFSINCIATDFEPGDYKPDEFSAGNKFISIGNTIIGAFQAIGSIASVLALVLVGIKYMMGSTEEKAEYKKVAIYYVIGAILVFSISNISAILYNFASTL